MKHCSLVALPIAFVHLSSLNQSNVCRSEIEKISYKMIAGGNKNGGHGVADKIELKVLKQMLAVSE